MEKRQVLRAFARSHHLETARPRPIDQLGCQRRLIAIGHGINDTFGARFLRQQRPSQNIGFDTNCTNPAGCSPDMAMAAPPDLGSGCKCDVGGTSTASLAPLFLLALLGFPTLLNLIYSVSDVGFEMPEP